MRLWLVWVSTKFSGVMWCSIIVSIVLVLNLSLYCFVLICPWCYIDTLFNIALIDWLIDWLIHRSIDWLIISSVNTRSVLHGWGGAGVYNWRAMSCVSIRQYTTHRTGRRSPDPGAAALFRRLLLYARQVSLHHAGDDETEIHSRQLLPTASTAAEYRRRTRQPVLVPPGR